MHVEYVRSDQTIGDSFLLFKETSTALIIEENEKGLPGPSLFINILTLISASIIKRRQYKQS